MREHPFPVAGTDRVGLGYNGTYLVLRKLRQDVASFWQYCWDAAIAERADDVAARAKLIAANGKLSIHVQSGNWLGLRKMLGQPLDESFSYGNRTIFLLWRSGSPSVISPSQLKVGDRISIRIRAPRIDSLQQAEQVPATHIGDHEPHTPA